MIRNVHAAPTVTEVKTVQVTAYDAATTYKLTVNGKVVSTIASGSANATATDLAAAWNASEEGEFAEVTASASTDTVTLTADTSGVPFTVTSSVSGGAGTIGAVTTTTSATSPEFWDDLRNWSGGAVPVNADDVFLGYTDYSFRYGLQTAVTLNSLTVHSTFLGDLGLPEYNTGGTATYHEYRPTALAIKATTVTVGEGDGTGSGRLKLDLSSTSSTVTVLSTGSTLDTDLPALQVKGTGAANVLNALGGSVGSAVLGGESATWATVRASGGASLVLGAGCTWTALEQTGGTVEVHSAGSTVTQNGGTLVVLGAGAISAITSYAAAVTHLGTGTLGTLTLAGSTFDRSTQLAGMTVTTCQVYAGSTILDPGGTVTWTNNIDLVACGIEDVTLVVGKNVTI